MARPGVTGLLILATALAACTTTEIKCPEKSGSSPGREVVCYTNSTEKLLQAEDAICRCTTIIHQGHDLRSLDASELKSFRDKAREANPDVRVMLSVSDKHGILKNSASTRQQAATHLTEVLKEVDGVELNVMAGSKDRLLSFVKGLREDMTNKSAERMILLTLPTRPEHLAKQFELKELSKYVDLFTVATHYLRDADEAHRAFHPSRLMGLFDMLNTDSLVDLISGMGAPKQKILISAPISAYRFTLKKAEDNTPWSSTVEEMPNSIDRKQLCEAMSDGEWMVERDEDLTAPYAFKNTTWIAFEDETSLKIKGKYVILRELAGLGLRDIENDVRNECGASLVQSVYQSFLEMKRKTREVVLSSLEKDLKETEIAYPRHVRSSEFRIVRVVDTEGKIRAVRENTQTAFTCTRQGYFVHPRSCNRFYRCVKFNQEVDDYSVFEFDCPAGLAFDERTEVCSWPGSLSTGSACPGSSEIEPVPRSRFRCPQQPGFYADRQNCRWFFACYDLGGPEMVPYEFRCPFGLVFDEQRLVCEWPWKVSGCSGPGHGSGHSVYNFGGTFEDQSGVPLGGIVGQGGFIGQSAYANPDVENFSGFNQGVQGINHGAGTYSGQNFNSNFGPNNDRFNYNSGGSDYNGQNYNAAEAGADYNGQFYNGAATAGSGSVVGGQNYNAAGAGKPYAGQTYIAPGAEASYDDQNYNAAAAGAPYSGQTYNAADAGASYDEQTFNAPGAPYAGQTYNSAGAGASYDGQTYSGAGTPYSYNAPEAQAPYVGQTYNSAGAETSYNGQNLNSAGIGAPYSGQTYNAAEAEAPYSGQTYIAPEAKAPYPGQTYNAAGAEAPYAGQAYNAPGAKAPYPGQTYNTAGAEAPYAGQAYNSPGTKAPYPGQTYNAAGAEAPYAGQAYNAPGTKAPHPGQTYNAADNDYNKLASQIANNGAATSQGGQVYNAGASDLGAGHGGYHYDKPVKEFHDGQDFARPSTVGIDSQRVNTNGFNAATTGLATDSADYDDQRGATSNGRFNGPSSIYANGGVKTTQYNSETATTFNNLAGSTGFTAAPTAYTAGSTNQFAAGETKGYAAGATGTGYTADTVGATNLGGVTDLSSGKTGTIDQNRGTAGISTIGFGNTANAFGTQNTQFNDVEGLTVYNATYNPTAGYPSSTILPFTGGQNNFDSTVYKGTNSVNFGGSTIAPNNYNTAGETPSAYGNSQYIGSSITANNNDVTQFRESTNTATGYNQGSTFNQNVFTDFARGSTVSPVAPTTVIPNYNNQGTRVPGVIPLSSSPRPEVELDNSGLFRGTTAGVNSDTQTTGYKTNEYYDNGGRGTIRYNNGIVTNKVTDNDIQDYRTSSYTRIPNSFIINAGNGENPQSTIVKADSANTQLFTKEGFTKTGPTKTGITTAQVGGSGSYVIGTGYPRARPDPQFIGENAFAGTFGNTGTTSNLGTNAGRTNYETSYTGGPAATQFSKTNTIANGNAETQGYSYPKPLVQLEINGHSTPSQTKTNFVSTTPSTYSTLDNQNSIIIDGAQDGGFSSTFSPVGFTTGQKEDFRTTVYQAAKIPQAVSTVRPVIDTGSRTVISSTPVPAVYSTPADGVTSTPKTYLAVGVSFDDYSLSPGSTGYTDYSDITANLDQGNFGQKIAGQSKVTGTNYQQPTTVNLKEENNNAITSTQEDYNNFATDNTAQTGYVRNNQPANFRPTVTLPKQVYIPSSTIAPAIGVTFRQPIVSAEIAQNQPAKPAGFSTNTNSINSASGGQSNRILVHYGTTNFAQRPTAGILINQAPAGFSSGGRVYGNQASTSYASQQSANQYFSNQASGNFAPQGSNGRIVINQGPTNFAFQAPINGAYGNQADYSSRGTVNGFSRNQASANSYSSPNQGFSGQTRTLVGSNVVTSIDLNNEVSRPNGDSLKVITEFNGGNLARLQSTTARPEVTTFSGDYARTQSTFDQNKKVVVKLSDLHPLIINKLGAECTCKADPFAVFRGPNRQSLPINSQNRGPVDLANYDEKDIYVDVESDKENAEEIDFARNIPSNRVIKTQDTRLRNGESNRNVLVSSRGEPSSTFLPPLASSSYLPPSSTYLPSTTAAPLSRNQARSQPLLIRVEDNFNSASVVRSRTGKALNGLGNANDLQSKKGPTSFRSTEEPVDGSLQCARPGLFRHPKLCNKFYACHWDEWKKRYTLHIFNCPVHLAFDASAGACNYPSKGPACQDNKLLV